MSRAVLMVDYGGVLGDHHQEPAESKLSELLGKTVAECRKLLSERSDQGRAFREDRITETQFWDWVFQLAGRAHEDRPTDQRLSRLWAETYRLNKDVAGLLGRARRRAAVGVVTNIDRARSRYLVEVVGIDQLVDLYLPSHRFGITKGCPGFWEVTTSEVRRLFGRVTITYVDDRTEHVAAASAAGCVGVQFNGVVGLENELRQHGLL